LENKVDEVKVRRFLEFSDKNLSKDELADEVNVLFTRERRELLS
jgi:hypothetical protein